MILLLLAMGSLVVNGQGTVTVVNDTGSQAYHLLYYGDEILNNTTEIQGMIQPGGSFVIDATMWNYENPARVYLELASPTWFEWDQFELTTDCTWQMSNLLTEQLQGNWLQDLYAPGVYHGDWTSVNAFNNTYQTLFSPTAVPEPSSAAVIVLFPAIMFMRRYLNKSSSSTRV